MIPEVGAYVVVYFRNSYCEKGFVKSWSKNIVVLQSQDELEETVFYTRDIFLYKVFKNKEEKVYSELKPKEALPKNHNDRLKNLSELHKIRIQEEKERVRRKLTEYKPTGTTQVKYGSPFLRNANIPILSDSPEED